MTRFSISKKAAIALACALLGAGGTACSRGPRSETPSTSDELRVWGSLSTNRVHVGDRVTLQLRVQHPAGAEVRVPKIAEASSIIVQNEQRTTRAIDKGVEETDFRFDLMSFDLGQHSLTTNAVVCVLSDGTTLQAPVPAMSFEVASILSETNAVLQPPRGLVAWPNRIPRWLWVLPCIALVAALAGWLVGRFLSKPRTILHMPPPEPPHEIALRALRSLKAKGWIETENAEPFYVELSSIVRRYIEDRFGIRAPELTTEEFIREAAQSNALTAPQQELVKDFLEQADLVKFAKFRPSRLEMSAAFEAAERLVLETAQPRSSEGTAT